ncbi:MAG: heat-inducible transcription repressor HrcA [bacterium]|nr:heat-inducible transcription repressor HrcA [bacterium]
MTNKAANERPLDEREAAILRAIAHEYIVTAKPVGSRSFVQKYSFSISPATMRNIMSDLEGMGFLMQPHTSAGRIPTDKGYRFYVDSLLDTYELSLSEEIKIKEEEMIKRELQLDKIFSSLTKMLSLVSKYAGVILTPKPDLTVVKRIELVPLDGNEILLILVARTGMVITKKVIISVTIPQDDLYIFSRYLTGELCGYPLYEIKNKIFNKLRNDRLAGMNKDMALDIAELAFSESDEPELHIDGIENLLKIPEMVEKERLDSLLRIIEEKNVLRDILNRNLERDGVLTLIGNEIAHAKVTGCSMVTASYKIGNKRVGVVGVIGPTRMDYEKVVPLIDYTGRVLSDLLTKMSK